MLQDGAQHLINFNILIVIMKQWIMIFGIIASHSTQRIIRKLFKFLHRSSYLEQGISNERIKMAVSPLRSQKWHLLADEKVRRYRIKIGEW